MTFSIWADGYALFRTHIHQRCLTGVIHGVMMPVASIGVGLMLRGVGGLPFALWMDLIIFGLWAVLGALSALEPCLFNVMNSGCEEEYLFNVITCLYYYSAVHLGLLLIPRPRYESGELVLGLVLLVLSVCIMEFVGHWLLEGHASDLGSVPNSIYHTLRYSTRSLLGKEECY